MVTALGGVIIWARHSGTDLDRSLEKISPAARLAVAIGVVLLIAASGWVAQALSVPVLRWLEGYWPSWLGPLSRRLVKRLTVRTDRDRTRWAELADRLDTASAEDYREYVRLDNELRRVPTQRRRLMPTGLGNLLRATEGRVWEKYGLDPVKCWPHLWLVIPEETRQQVATARRSLDAGAVAFLWGLLFLAWTPWAWWALVISVAVMTGAYRWSLTAADIYSDVVEAAFDVHRPALYHALRWPMPKNPAEERACGRSLTNAIWRGSDARPPSTPLPNQPDIGATMESDQDREHFRQLAWRAGPHTLLRRRVPEHGRRREVASTTSKTLTASGNILPAPRCTWQHPDSAPTPPAPSAARSPLAVAAALLAVGALTAFLRWRR